jgi:hypothetical protein
MMVVSPGLEKEEMKRRSIRKCFMFEKGGGGSEE